jgi:type II secretory pathway pseudopilin PulG
MNTLRVKERPVRRSGFTLIEITAVIGVLFVMMSMILLTITSMMKIESSGEVFYQSLVDHANTGEQFRSDVSQAASAPRQWNKYQAAPDCLILEIGNDSHIVYQWDGRKLMRFHFQGDITKSRQLPGNERAEFSQPDPRRCQLRLTAESGPRARFPNEIVAALGGERR